jgi:uncharacterized 2Fe-2S/4Fe-4S cluster protein (DUF4445 family)
MPNSSSSKYVKRRRHIHRHRHTKSRIHANKYTIKKVMRGCSSKQVGGGKLEVHIPHNANDQQKHILRNASSAVVNANNFPVKPVPYIPSSSQNFAAVGGNTAQSGGYKSKHRRHRYKKSVGRRGRSRRCKDSCK